MKSLLFSLRTRENATLCANAATKLYEKYEFRESKTFGGFIRRSPSKKKSTCPLLEGIRFSNVSPERLWFDEFLVSETISLGWPLLLPNSNEKRNCGENQATLFA